MLMILNISELFVINDNAVINVILDKTMTVTSSGKLRNLSEVNLNRRAQWSMVSVTITYNWQVLC